MTALLRCQIASDKPKSIHRTTEELERQLCNQKCEGNITTKHAKNTKYRKNCDANLLDLRAPLKIQEVEGPRSLLVQLLDCVIPAWKAGIQVDMDVSGRILANLIIMKAMQTVTAGARKN